MVVRFILAMWLAGNVLCWSAADAPVRLAGIVTLGTNRLALIENNAGAGVFLKEGERQEYPFPMEVISITSDSGRAEVLYAQRITNLALSIAAEKLPKKPAVILESANAISALELYQMAAERTLLRPSTLVIGRINLILNQGATRAEIIQGLAKALADKGIYLRDYGDKFCVAVMTQQTNLLADVPPPPLSSNNNKGRDTVGARPADSGIEEVIPAGVVRFREADINAALDVFAELNQRTILRPSALPNARISLSTKTQCSRDEVLWLFDTALHLEGFKVQRHGEKFVYVGPPALAKLVPEFPKEAAKGEANLTAKIDFSQPLMAPPPPKPVGQPPAIKPLPMSNYFQLLKLYAETTGREPVFVPPEPAGLRAVLRTQAPLTKGEMIYALDAAAALNGFQFELVGDKQVKITVPNQKGGGKSLQF